MRKLLCTVASAALAFSSTAFAQNAFPSAAPNAPAFGGSPPAVGKATAKQLTVEDLGTMLENLGYELVPVKGDKGELFGYDTKDTTEGWTLNARIELSPSGKFVWITGVVAKVDNVNDVSKEALLAMLVESQKLGPAHVHYSTAFKSFMLAVAMPNANFTAVEMRGAMTLYTDSLKQAIKSWETATKPTPAPAPTTND